MARRRMIDPNFWESEDVSRLSLFARLLFIGMISNADDEGRGRAHPVYLKSVVFPYDEIETEKVEKALEEIAANTSAVIYRKGKNRYYAFLNWRCWQRVEKPQPSNIPPMHAEEPAEERDSGRRLELFRNDSGTAPETLRDESRLREEKKKEEKGRESIVDGAASPPPRSPAFQMPLNDGSLFAVFQEDCSRWGELYPGVDISQELRKMIGWLEAHRKRRKTRNGILPFINGWLAREQDKCRMASAAGAEDERDYSNITIYDPLAEMD